MHFYISSLLLKVISGFGTKFDYSYRKHDREHVRDLLLRTSFNKIRFIWLQMVLPTLIGLNNFVPKPELDASQFIAKQHCPLLGNSVFRKVPDLAAMRYAQNKRMLME